MASSTTANLLEQLRQHRLLEPGKLDEVRRKLQGKNLEPRTIAQKLIEAGLLTSYQAKQLLQGRGQDLVIGQYVVLEQVGEGGMGQVFKARHTNLARLVALKVIRKERLKSPNAVRRFQREVEIASKLSHPNIVMAYDAGQAGNTHYFAMEYVEGIDLAMLVKQKGPLPIDKACAWIGQAAQGLQHAYERGLVHRDIKPSNLLLERASGIVKVLDMGLALVADDDDTASSLTMEGSVLGTLDYLSPEQALNAHQADIRSDMYSLGCSFYFLLTGKAPFAGGSATEKLLKHRMEEPVPVEKLRSNLPPAVGAAARKLMAKRPEDRYQTPADAVAALANAVQEGGQKNSQLALRRPRRFLKKWLLLLAAAFFVCVLALIVGLAGRYGGQPGGDVIAKATPPKSNSGKTTSPLTMPSKLSTPQTTPDRTSTPTIAEAGKPLVNSIGMKLAYIAPGKFLMGSSAGDIDIARKAQAFPAGEWDKTEGPQHPVTIGKPFHMGVYAVTQGQYEKVMGNNPATNKESPNHPVETVSWNDAMEFCRKLSDLPEEKKAGHTYRLPTEAEWEYACRAGTTTLFHFGNSSSSLQANFNGEQPFPPAPRGPRRAKTTPVGSYQPNPWGLYDMHGNVYQWCLDSQRNYTPNAVTDPRGPETPGVPRMLRGGDWSGPAWVCRSACRVKTRDPATYRTDRSGFRVVCE